MKNRQLELCNITRESIKALAKEAQGVKVLEEKISLVKLHQILMEITI